MSSDPATNETQSPTLRIGTRGSPLALIQAHEVRDRLVAAHGQLMKDAIEIVVIKTSGDARQDVALKTIGGKGLFTKEIEQSLQDGRIDIAVHSMKDVPTKRQAGLQLTAILPREDVRDALISRRFTTLGGLPSGALIGTASLRRQAQIRRLRSDLRVVMFRGNVQTRLKKLDGGEADATLLAAAGLSRLDALHEAQELIAPDAMLPAIAQGAIGIETRADDTTTNAFVSVLDHSETAVRVYAERSFLARLDGNCTTPIAGLAELSSDGARLTLRGEILLPDGSEAYAGSREGATADGEAMGADLADELRANAGAGFFEKLEAQATAVAETGTPNGGEPA